MEVFAIEREALLARKKGEAATEKYPSAAAKRESESSSIVVSVIRQSSPREKPRRIAAYGAGSCRQNRLHIRHSIVVPVRQQFARHRRHADRAGLQCGFAGQPASTTSSELRSPCRQRGLGR